MSRHESKGFVPYVPTNEQGYPDLDVILEAFDKEDSPVLKDRSESSEIRWGVICSLIGFHSGAKWTDGR